MFTNQNLSNIYISNVCTIDQQNKRPNGATPLTIARMTLFGRSNDIAPHGPSVE